MYSTPSGSTTPHGETNGYGFPVPLIIVCGAFSGHPFPSQMALKRKLNYNGIYYEVKSRIKVASRTIYNQIERWKFTAFTLFPSP